MQGTPPKAINTDCTEGDTDASTEGDTLASIEDGVKNKLEGSAFREPDRQPPGVSKSWRR
jgi:hypothetical protein